MKRIPCERGAFSLVEVVIAVGLVAFALLAMMGLISSLMGGARGTAAENEALQMVSGLNEFLQTQGFTNVYSWASGSASQPPIIGFQLQTNDRTEQMFATNVSDPNLALHSGRMFRIVLRFPTNNPLGITSLPASTNYTNFALPLRVEMYNAPRASLAPASNNLVITYDTAVLR